MENNNKTLANLFSEDADCYTAALGMAELKDKAIKQFFIEHIYPDISIETNEDGEPLVESFVSANMKRFELAEEMFNRYKEFEKRFV